MMVVAINKSIIILPFRTLCDLTAFLFPSPAPTGMACVTTMAQVRGE